jgi:hypothetical protein
MMKVQGISLRGLFVFALFSCAYAVTSLAHAATLYMDPAETHAYRADTFTVAVRIDTDVDECINTVDGVITYDPSVIAVDVSRGDSILSLWVEDPKIDQQNRRITFAGGIPNGYCGRVAGDPRLTNVIARLVFQVPGFSVGGGDDDGIADISFAPETRVLLNDGTGNDAPLRTFPSRVILDDRAGNEVRDEWGDAVDADTEPPAPFSIELVQNDEVFNGDYYIVFSTTDKQSGLDHYEIYEEPIEEMSLFKWGAPDRAWGEAKNPYVLADQDLKSIIRVKAIDKAGNERIAVFAPEDAARIIDPLVAVLAIVGAVAVLIIVIGGAFFIRRRFFHRNEHTDTQSLDDHDET